MKRSSGRMAAAGLLAAAIAACSPTTRASVPRGVPPVARGEASRPPAPEARADRGRPRYTEADVRFMRGMIAHHAQALAMTSLVPTRSTREDIRRLAERIEVSQRDEIAMMGRWLETRGEEVPSLDAHSGHHGAGGQHARMPGMLTREELARLAAATGPEFDRLFLESMIRHHEGALAMVAELLASEGAAQEPEIFQFASEVDADQRMEITRMRGMLSAPPAGALR
jgi:uncharacterized protein (DUF305 family)